MTTSKIRCNNCMNIYNESDLIRIEDSDGALDACPKCKTEKYLMQPYLNSHETVVDILKRIADDLKSGRLNHEDGNQNALSEINEVLKLAGEL